MEISTAKRNGFLVRCRWPTEYLAKEIRSPGPSSSFRLLNMHQQSFVLCKIIGIVFYPGIPIHELTRRRGRSGYDRREADLDGWSPKRNYEDFMTPEDPKKKQKKKKGDRGPAAQCTKALFTLGCGS